MARYSEERKANILAKLLPPHNMKVADVAAQEGISLPTLYNWRKQARIEGHPVPGHKPTSEQWSPEAKLAVVTVFFKLVVTIYLLKLLTFPLHLSLDSEWWQQLACSL